MKKIISVILPCHNEGRNIPSLIPEIIKNIPQKYGYEIICVDDGSNDDTWKAIFKAATSDKRIKGVALARRSGHQVALIAGISESHGETIITMDADFQHPPELLGKMITFWEKGHDLVLAKKSEITPQNLFNKTCRRIAYRLLSFISGGLIVPGVSDFNLIDRKCVNFILNSEEREIFLRGMANQVSSNPVTFTYKVNDRKFGKSSYSPKMLINLFMVGFVSFSTIPLRLGALFGILLMTTTALFITFDILRALIVGQKIIQGWLTVVVLMMLLNGFLIFYIGILGEYIGIIFKEVKKRPRYLATKTVNLS